MSENPHVYGFRKTLIYFEIIALGKKTLAQVCDKDKINDSETREKPITRKIRHPTGTNVGGFFLRRFIVRKMVKVVQRPSVKSFKGKTDRQTNKRPHFRRQSSDWLSAVLVVKPLLI